MTSIFSTAKARKMSRLKIVIVHASHLGSTVEVAENMRNFLRKRGATVTVKPITSVTDINNYNAIIIGSPIQYDRWRPEAEHFVLDHQDVLKKLPVAYFFTCLVLSKKSPKAQQQAMKYANKLKNLAPEVHPVSIGAFAGVLDYDKIPFFLRLLARGIFAILGVQKGDYRDWPAIYKWVKSIPFTQ